MQYRRRVFAYAWAVFEFLTFLLFCGFYIYTFGISILALFFFIIILGILIIAGGHIAVGILAVFDFAMGDFDEIKATYRHQFISEGGYYSFFTNSKEKKRRFYRLVFTRERYYHFRSPLYFELVKNRAYRITVAKRSRILIHITELDGTEVFNSEFPSFNQEIAISTNKVKNVPIYRKRLVPYIWVPIALMGPFLLIYVYYIWLHGIGTAFIFLVALTCIWAKHAVFGIPVGVFVLSDLLTDDFIEFEATYVEQFALKPDVKLVIGKKPLGIDGKDTTTAHLSSNSIKKQDLIKSEASREKEKQFYVVIFKLGRYYHLDSPLHFEMENGANYLVTMAYRAQVIVDVKNLDGTSLPAKEKFIEQVNLGYRDVFTNKS